MKKAIVLLVFVLSILLSSCSSGTDSNTPQQSTSNSTQNINSYNSDNINNDQQDSDPLIYDDINVSNLNIQIDINGFVNEYITDDVILLTNYSPTSTHDEMCYDVDMSQYVDISDFGIGFYFITKNADEPIPKIRKTDTIGITNACDFVDIIPIGSASPKYAVDVNFADVRHTFDSPRQRPEFLFSREYAFDFILSECNGEYLTTFVNDHSDKFTAVDNLTNKYNRLFITGKKNEEFTFGGYVNTTWREDTRFADIEYYKIYQKDKEDPVTQTVSTQKTKNGYFTVDFSNLSSGLYYIVTFNSFVELV